MNSRPLNQTDKRGTLSEEEYVLVPRKELLLEHDTLMARLHQLRRQLKFPPLLTGHQQRDLAHK